MNFDDAVASHIKWKVRLNKFIEGDHEEYHQLAICPHTECELGKWISGEGKQFNYSPNYELLIDRHTHFHKLAQDVVKMVETGDREGAKRLVAGPFTTASKDTVYSIIQLKRDVHLHED